LIGALRPKINWQVLLQLTWNPRDWESMIDEATLREHTANTFEFHLIKNANDARIAYRRINLRLPLAPGIAGKILVANLANR
jgi:hypothetical protein